MLILATKDITTAIGQGLTTFAVVLVLGWIWKSAQAETLASAGQRKIAYPKALKVFTILAWLAIAGMAIFAGFTAKKEEIKLATAAIGLLVLFMLPVHLETFRISITWDDTHIYTRSPWRKARKIPFSAVQSCDYSKLSQWYRIRTNGFGIVRLHQLTKGIPELLAVLPCPHPGYPPGRPGSEVKIP